MNPYWDWNKPRTREGYYRFQGGTEAWYTPHPAACPALD